MGQPHRSPAEPSGSERLATLRVVGAMLAVFVIAAVALLVLEERADRIRRTELALTRIQSRASLQSLLQQRALDSGAVTESLATELRSLDRQIDASVDALPPGEGLDMVRAAVVSHQKAVRESIALVGTGELAQAQIHDHLKVDRWFEVLARSTHDALAVQKAVATRTDRLTRGGSLVTLLIACLMVGFVLWRFERSRMAAAAVRQRAVEESEARFRALVGNSSDVVTVVDADGIVTYLSPSATKAFGHSSDDVMGTSISVLVDAIVHPDDRAAVVASVRAALGARSEEGSTFEFRARGRDGSWRFVEAMATDSLDDPNVCGIIITGRDITQRKSLEERLRHQAFHDSLTQLPNRALLLDRMEIALARRARETPLGVLLLDLDGFKRVNDSLGHAAGDRLLVQVAERLTQCLRGGDSVARLGGDEFAVLLEELARPDDVAAVAERMLELLGLPFEVSGREIFIHASVGVVVSYAGSHSSEDLLREADVAMYAAKTEGKNRYKVFEPSMGVAVMDRVTLETDLRTALDRHELVLFYQPVVELTSGRIRGTEALLRWAHPERGLVRPTSFIPLAEETGLIVPIGRWALREACRQLAAWQRDFDTDPPLDVSVNLSGRQVQDTRLVDDIGDAIATHGLSPSSIVLEITESVLMEHSERVADVFAGLRELGVRLAIDDFGTGYSSLSYLHSFPIEILKIDRSFVSRVADGPEESALARAIVKLAHTLDLGIVAEGIEQEDQLDKLRELGCPLGQGFLFAPPVAPADATRLFDASFAGGLGRDDRSLAPAT